MSPDEREVRDLIQTRLAGVAHAQRFLVALEGATGNVDYDNERPWDLRDLADAGHGKYFTDGETFEALVGYDIANDRKHYVIYRLPRA